jgi:hypothetical protein
MFPKLQAPPYTILTSVKNFGTSILRRLESDGGICAAAR